MASSCPWGWSPGHEVAGDTQWEEGMTAIPPLMIWPESPYPMKRRLYLYRGLCFTKCICNGFMKLGKYNVHLTDEETDLKRLSGFSWSEWKLVEKPSPNSVFGS